MTVVEVKKNTLKMDALDWERLNRLKQDFDKVCNSCYCSTCPLEKFCKKYDCPADYLTALSEYLED